MQEGRWLRLFLGLFVAALLVCGCIVYYLDPFFHYHGPRAGFVYELNNQRSQNDGITRHFSYEALITGTSMSENFRTSSFARLFSLEAVKLPYPGARYKEINDNLKKALRTGNVKVVVRPLDDSYLLVHKDAQREDLGEYPVWLTNNNPFDDVKYLLNLDVLGGYCVPMCLKKAAGEAGSVTSFDEYGVDWPDDPAERNALGGLTFSGKAIPQEALTDAEAAMVLENIRQNVTDVIAEYPDTEFYYFFPPYSIVHYGELYENGELEKILAAEELVAEEMCGYENLHLFSFSHNAGVITSLDNYKDSGHYSPEICDWMLEEMRADRGRLTPDTLHAYFDDLRAKLLSYDYQNLRQ
ncbi:MAG: hypothetical protein J5935_00860 [Lachnospiraceae bacterium]|nr:hypothetical protein [Lachnospiraceae bacterium]